MMKHANWSTLAAMLVRMKGGCGPGTFWKKKEGRMMVDFWANLETDLYRLWSVAISHTLLCKRQSRGMLRNRGFYFAHWVNRPSVARVNVVRDYFFLSVYNDAQQVRASPAIPSLMVTQRAPGNQFRIVSGPLPDRCKMELKVRMPCLSTSAVHLPDTQVCPEGSQFQFFSTARTTTDCPLHFASGWVRGDIQIQLNPRHVSCEIWVGVALETPLATFSK